MPSLWTKKNIDELKKEASDTEHGLRRTLGPLALISLGIGAIVGAGIFVLSGVAAQHTGPALVGSVILSGVGCAFAGLCYAEFSSMIPVAGSAYTYAYATVGEFLAWIIGWDLILEYAVGATTVSIGWSGYLVSFLQKTLHWPFPAELSKSPWETLRLADGTVVHPIFNLPAAFIVILITTLLIIGIRESANFNSTIVLIKVGVVLLFIFFGAMYVHRANWHPFLPANQGTFGELAFPVCCVGRASFSSLTLVLTLYPQRPRRRAIRKGTCPLAFLDRWRFARCFTLPWSWFSRGLCLFASSTSRIHWRWRQIPQRRVGGFRPS